jgi:signal transduction histidine kinase
MGNAVIPTIGLYSWTGVGAGVPYHAHVLAIDGHPVGTSADVYSHVAALPVGTPVRYLLAKGKSTFTLDVPTMRFGPEDYWLTVGLFVIYGFLSLGAGTVVDLLQPRSAAARAFLLQGFLSGLAALTGTALYHPDLWWLSRFQFLTHATFPAAFIHLGMVFPVERRFLTRHRAWIIAPYAIGVLLTAWVLKDFYALPPATTPLYAIYLYTAFSIVVAVGLLAYSYWENRTPLVRQQLLFVVPGFALGAGVGLFCFLNVARSGGDFPMNLIATTPILFYLSIGYAIAKHDLFDIDAAVKQAVVYGILTVGITAAYAGSLVVLGLLLPPQLVRASPVFNVAFVVLVAVAFEPLRIGIQHVVDRAFYRNRVDYRSTVGEVSAALTSLLDLAEVLGRVGRTVTEGIQLRSMAVLLWLGDTRVWRYDPGTGRIADITEFSCDAIRHELVRNPQGPWMVQTEAEGRTDGAAAAVTSGSKSAAGPAPAGAATAARLDMAALGATLVVPLRVGARVIGAFALGPKRSGQPLRRDDLELLTTLAAQSAVAIQNAHSYQALEDLNEQLETKVHERTAALAASYDEIGHAYRELQTAQAQLVQTEKMASLGQLVAGVAHEINNPVSFIVGNIEPLRRRLGVLRALAARHADVELGTAVDRVLEVFDVIGRGAERTAGIVKDLRTFSRLGGETQPRPVDVHEGIEVSLSLLRPRWADRITIHREYGTLPAVVAAPGQINQVLMNVLANACDAISTLGTIWIRTVCEGSQVTITVRDDGPGVAPEHLHRIFDPFFTTKPVGKGMGLGLAISHGIVTSHGGTIRVTSTPGQGTEFAIVLPVRAVAQAS